MVLGFRPQTDTMINFSTLQSRTLAGKIIRAPLRLLPPGLTVPVLQGPLKGKKWIVGSHVHGCWLGSYEVEIQLRLLQQVRPGNIFYDIGANVGFYSLLAALVCDPGQVCAFEPVPANLAYLRKHLELNHLTNVHVFPMAISDTTGMGSFYLSKTRATGRLEADGNVRVQISSLDALIQRKNLPPPDCIKMDIEGAEFRALLGAKECFARHHPKLFLATHGATVHADCCRLLSDWQYKYESTSKQPEDDGSGLFAWFDGNH